MTDTGCEALPTSPDADVGAGYDPFVVCAWLLGLGLCAAFWAFVAFIILWPSTWKPFSPF